MFMRPTARVLLVLATILLLVPATFVEAKVFMKDGIEGITIKPLAATLPDANTTYATSTTVSPFTSRTFGTSTVSGKMTDNSSTSNPYLLSSGLGVSSSDWVNVQFDFRTEGTKYWAVEYLLGGSVNTFDLGFNGANICMYGKLPGETTAHYITIPGVGGAANEWYHVDALFAPSSWTGNDRTFRVTVTRYNGGNLLTGTLQAVLQADSNPINYFKVHNYRFGPSTIDYASTVDNVLIETFSPSDLVKDGCFESPTTNILSLVNGGTNATYTTTATYSTIASNRFTTGAAGDLNDASTTLAPGLQQTGFSASNKGYVHAQFDFKPVSGSYNQWSFILSEASGTAPHAVDLRFNGANLAVYGRKRGGTAALINIPNVTVNTSCWYRADVYLAPSYLAANDRTYSVRVTQYDGATTTVGEVTDILNEDSGALTTFKVLNSGTATNQGRLLIDNVLIESLLDTTTEFRYGYYPTPGKIRAFVQYQPQYASNWDVRLVKVSDGSTVVSQNGTFPFNPAGLTLDIPSALTNGADYKVRLTLSGTGVSDDVIERTFTHRTFTWNGSTLGTDNTVVVPPFTNMVTNTTNKTVDCVLRTYTMNNVGLWQQVSSQGTDILNGPITLSLVSSSTTYTASTGTNPTFTTTQPYQVTGTSASWTAGPITGTTSFDYDYDGLMKVTLNLGTVPTSVTSMYLDIPLKNSEAWLMHEVTDSLRGHKAQRIPAGTGSVWNSTGVYRSKIGVEDQLPGPFVPYIWIGGPERGVCWFAENDKDWSLDKTTPVLELIRTGTTELKLRVKFFTTAPATARTRTISFGLMATPAKPLLTTPTTVRNWCPSMSSTNDNRLTFRFLGSDYSWGSQTPCLQFYPAFHNYGVYDEFVKSRDSGQSTTNYASDRMTNLFSGTEYSQALKDLMTTNLNGAFHVARDCRNSDMLSNYLVDTMEGTQTLQFNNGGDAANTYNGSYATNPSPFTSVEFSSASTRSGLLTDNSTTTTPYLYRTAIGSSSSDWHRLSFDVRFNSAGNNSYWQWGYFIGDSFSSPYAFDLRLNAGAFKVMGRRKTTDTLALIAIPNLSYTTNTWYHVEAILKPANLPAAERTYDVTVSQQNADGTWTSGTLRGILQEDTGAPSEFYVRNVTYGQTGTGAIQVDNVIISKVKPKLLFAYTNGRGVVWDKSTEPQETRTYLDEWSIYDPADPRWENAIAIEYDDLGNPCTARMVRELEASYNEFTGSAYSTDTIGSYQDMALYYHQKMYNTFLNGIYWDDWFLQANYTPISGVGPAYVGDDGKLHPGVNIYAFRNLAKRNMIMQYQMGMQPQAWFHMTNCNIVPILSFGTLNYDYEWTGPYAASLTDYDTDRQDGYGLDSDTAFVLAQSTGLQTGNVGVMLSFYGKGSTTDIQNHLRKSELAICLVHEMKLNAYNTTDVGVANDRMYSFGYGQSDCEVYRYWDSTQSNYATSTGGAVKMLVLKRPNGSLHKAFLVISGFDSAATPAATTVTVDMDALGLPDGYRAWDETNSGDPVEVSVTNDQFTVTIPRHEYKLIRLQ